jgi:hypothetical protein
MSPGPVPVTSSVPSGLIRRTFSDLKSPDLADVDLDKMYLDVVTEDYKTAITRSEEFAFFGSPWYM